YAFRLFFIFFFFFFSSRRRHTRWPRDWSSDVCSSDLDEAERRDSDPPVCRGTQARQTGGSESRRSASSRGRASAGATPWRRNTRSEERRVGKECRYRRSAEQ